MLNNLLQFISRNDIEEYLNGRTNIVKVIFLGNNGNVWADQRQVYVVSDFIPTVWLFLVLLRPLSPKMQYECGVDDIWIHSRTKMLYRNIS